MSEETNQCTRCKEFKSLSCYKKNNRYKGNLHLYCKPCATYYSGNYYQKNKDLCKARTKQKNKIIREKILNFYGNKCACCNEANSKFLTIDHTNGDGSEHRRSISKTKRNSASSFYKWIIKNNYPNFLRLLCWNCNSGREYNIDNKGVCPHEETQIDWLEEARELFLVS